MKKRIFKKKYGLILISRVEDTVEAWGSCVVCEMSIWSVKTNQLVGHWEYGHYDPELPFTGQDFARCKVDWS